MVNQNLAEQLGQKFPNIVVENGDVKGYPTVVIKKEGILNLAAALKSDPQFGFNVLMDLTAVDYLFWEEKGLRFEVVYNLYSTSANRRLFVKAQVPEADCTIDSVAGVWPAADWFEREIWDMFGIQFKGHPNLKRILMYEEFKGHPLRKDYPYTKRQPLIGPVN